MESMTGVAPAAASSAGFLVRMGQLFKVGLPLRPIDTPEGLVGSHLSARGERTQPWPQVLDGSTMETPDQRAGAAQRALPR